MLTDALHIRLAELLKSSGGFVLALGRGDPAWEEASPSPGETPTALVDEVARVPVPAPQIAFLDGEGRPTARSTSHLQFTATVEGGQARGPVREMGLYDGATTAPGTGTLLAYRVHRRLDLTPALRMTRTIRIDLGGGRPAAGEARYLGNTRTEELHDLQNLTDNCQLDEIRVDHRYGFASVDAALAMGYDRCAYCFGRELSTR